MANYIGFFFKRLDLKEVKCQENSHLICNALILKCKHSTLAKLQLLLALLLLNVKARFHKHTGNIFIRRTYLNFLLKVLLQLDFAFPQIINDGANCCTN